LLERIQPQWFPWGGAFGRLSSATMGNPNHLSALLSVGLPVFFALGGRWRWLSFGVILGIAVTGTRLSILTALLLLGMGVLFSFRRLWWLSRAEGEPSRKQGVAKQSKIELLFLFACVLLLAFSVPLLSPQKHLAHLNVGKGGLTGRIHLLRCAMPLLRESMPWGIGYGRFRQAFPPHYGRCLRGSRFAKERTHTIPMNLHHDFLEKLIEGGLLFGLFLLLALVWWGRLFFVIWRGGRRPLEEDVQLADARAWLFLPSLGLACQMMGSFPLQLPSVLSLVSLCLVLAVFFAPANPAHSTPPKEEEASAQQGALWKGGLRAGMALVWAMVLFWTIQAYRAERTLFLATVAAEQKREDAESLFLKSLALYPSEQAAFYLGQYRLAMRRPEEALAPLLQAYETLPDVQVAITLAEAYLALAKRDEAKRWMERALALQPHHPEALQLQKRF
jgi:hypothetical protein